MITLKQHSAASRNLINYACIKKWNDAKCATQVEESAGLCVPVSCDPARLISSDNIAINIPQSVEFAHDTTLHKSPTRLLLVRCHFFYQSRETHVINSYIDSLVLNQNPICTHG